MLQWTNNYEIKKELSSRQTITAGISIYVKELQPNNTYSILASGRVRIAYD